jgi:hypothetical protein
MQDKAEDAAKFRRESLQLQRLARMVDVVYAIIIWRAFTLLPKPTAEQLSWEHFSAFLSANIAGFLLVIIGIVVAIIYWIQNNVVFGNLQSTDSRHSILSILQLFFLLVFLLSLVICCQKSSFALARSHRAVCAPIERSDPDRADHRHHHPSICVYWTDPLGNLLAELSAGGFAGKGSQTGEKGGIKKRP